MFDQYFDDLEVGDRRAFKGVTVTEAHIVGFAGITGDHYALHTDATYAEGTMFGQRIAHGLLVLSCSVGLVPLEPGRVLAFLGLDKVRFSAPTYIGDTIHPEVAITGKRATDDGGIVVVGHEVKNQRGETVCSASLKLLMAGRPPS
ncbi:MAG: dehydratase [Actinomycetota bacterium]|nr:dehydratase [Actinomycetota bacterium]